MKAKTTTKHAKARRARRLQRTAARRARRLQSERGFVLWQGKSEIDGAPIAAIATMKSTNSKTDNMIQVWILRTDMSPTEAVKAAADRSICGDCKHRHALDGGCYVVVAKAPQSVYKAFKRGAYPSLQLSNVGAMRAVFGGRKVRFGAYGDPAFLPLYVLSRVAAKCEGWTGYTHQWQNVSPAYKRYLMASVDNATEKAEARARGWRTFRIVQAPTDRDRGDEIFCPADHPTKGSMTTCLDCTACDGQNEDRHKGRRSIVIPGHGFRVKRLKLDV